MANEGPRQRGRGHVRIIGFGTLFVLGACNYFGGIDDPQPSGESGGAGGATSGGGAGGCTSASQCPGTDDDCMKRTCANEMCGVEYSPLGTPCNQTGACNATGECKKDLGALCSAASECFNELCVEGHCCDKACDGVCEACTASAKGQGADGICGPMKGIADPNNDLSRNHENCGTCGTICSTSTNEWCVSGACENLEWASWPMPNPVGTVLPNQANYTVDTAKGIVRDNITELMWQRNVDVGSYAFADAKIYCANLVYGGYSDWRLPTAIELVSLVDFTKVSPGPTIDTNTYPNTPNAHFWTSSPLAGDPSKAWSISFDTGGTYFGDVTSAYRVRCVR